MTNNQNSTDNKRPDDSFALNKKIPKFNWLFTILILIALFSIVGGAIVVYSKITSNNAAITNNY